MRLRDEIEQVRRARTTIEERLLDQEARVAWLSKEADKSRAIAASEQKMRQGVEVEVESLRDELKNGRRVLCQFEQQIENLKAERTRLLSEKQRLENSLQEQQAATPQFDKPTGRFFFISDFYPEQIPLSGCTFRMRPITKDDALDMLAKHQVQSGLSPRVADLMSRVLGRPLQRGRRPDLKPGDQAILVSWQNRHSSPRDGTMSEDEFRVWAQWLRWGLIQIGST